MREPARGPVRGPVEVTRVAVDRVVDMLADAQWRVPIAAFPASPREVDRPGLYAWFVDEAGAQALSRGLGIGLEPGLIYAGQAGAGTSSATLRSRISGNHRSGSIRGSTFRRTLAALLGDELGLRRDGPDRLGDDGEVRLSAWMREHLQIAVAPWDDRTSLGRLEDLVLDRLDPPLSLEGMRRSPARMALSQLRATTAAVPMATRPRAAVAPSPEVRRAPTAGHPPRLSGAFPDMATHLATLVGRTIPTMTGRPNRIIRVSGDRVWVATARSPEGQPVAVAEVQAAADQLFAQGELIVDVATVGHRSAFVGAVLGTLPGVVAVLRPRRLVLTDRTSGP